MEDNINPDTIIEFARIFGFEIDFQRDIRKNDYFKILYEKYFDENREFIKSGSILYAHMVVNEREITLYKFGNDKDYGYFDLNAKSVEKALMKTPINGSKLSSFLVIAIVVLLVIGTENFTIVFLFVDALFSIIISILFPGKS